MAIIFADDFQQWPAALGSGFVGSSSPFLITEMSNLHLVYQRVEAMGFHLPALGYSSNGGAWSYPTVYYDINKKLLQISDYRPSRNQYAFSGASGLRRTISYKGDKLYASFALEFGGAATDKGDFLLFGTVPAGPNDYTAFNAVPQPFLYAVGIDANGFYTFNGISTEAQAFYRPASVRAFIDVVFASDYMELWVNDVMVSRQDSLGIMPTEIALTMGKIGGTNGTSGVVIWVHSYMLSDNSGGFGQRMGRKVVKTQQVQAITTDATVSASPANSTALSVIRKYADDPAALTSTNMIGHLTSSAGYTNMEFTVPAYTGNGNVYAVIVHAQFKRLTPSGDGLGLRPYATVSGTKKWGNVTAPSSTWKLHTLELEAVPKDTTTFGFLYDYADTNKLYISDVEKVEVYGNPAPAHKLYSYLGQPTFNLTGAETATFDAYVFDYARSNLSLTKTDIQNISFMQNQ
ncbi:hypothetical protein LU11_gp249 [Pseudomonas phage Lu11]|uniref:hypothetical protein n=1 Tax=Pseudomonas phage Lu11 TaxID=1161927 RepID=UPI00025F1820|nr:hypothetical protein LU11_gp249 [Pseudomonas phage Lu11]AFH14780.1 hypothetical protein Lu11_0244 [Pseudomonas phage Lu11]